jgi:hypothetical protein
LEKEFGINVCIKLLTKSNYICVNNYLSSNEMHPEERIYYGYFIGSEGTIEAAMVRIIL